MEILVTFEEHSASREVLRVEDKIGEGKFVVHKVYSPSHNTHYALKLFSNDVFGDVHIRREGILSELSHPHIIKSFSIKCHNNDYSALLMEFAKYGSFLDLAMKRAFKSEIIIRTYFHQLIEGMQYLHSKGLAHLDLKLDNLVLNSDCALKIIDFDQVQSIKDSKMIHWGSPGYRAPEVLNGQCEDLQAVDVYSAGIILYTLLARAFPFAEISTSTGTLLKCYYLFVNDNNKFWEMKADSQQDKNIFNDDLIELLNGMLDSDVQMRFTIQEIMNSKWFKGPVLSAKDLEVQMKATLDGRDSEQKKNNKKTITFK